VIVSAVAIVMFISSPVAFIATLTYYGLNDWLVVVFTPLWPAQCPRST
jgi:hypothetical protein